MMLRRISFRPLGVRVVAWLTLLSSSVLFSVFVMGIALAGIGGFPGGNPSPFDWRGYMLHVPIIPASPALSFCAFFLSIAVLDYIETSPKYVWHASIPFWIGTLLFFSWWIVIFFGDSGCLTMDTNME